MVSMLNCWLTIPDAAVHNDLIMRITSLRMEYPRAGGHGFVYIIFGRFAAFR
jgi:hypothetical protein